MSLAFIPSFDLQKDTYNLHPSRRGTRLFQWRTQEEIGGTHISALFAFGGKVPKNRKRYTTEDSWYIITNSEFLNSFICVSIWDHLGTFFPLGGVDLFLVFSQQVAENLLLTYLAQLCDHRDLLFMPVLFNIFNTKPMAETNCQNYHCINEYSEEFSFSLAPWLCWWKNLLCMWISWGNVDVMLFKCTVFSYIIHRPTDDVLCAVYTWTQWSSLTEITRALKTFWVSISCCIVKGDHDYVMRV